MTDREQQVVPLHPQGSVEDAQLPHEQLDVYAVLEQAYRTAMSWQGISWSRGTTGDHLKRAASSAVLRYTEGYYTDGGNKVTLWKGARASCGEAAAAVQLLAIDGSIPTAQAAHVRTLLARAMRMLARLLQPL